MPKNYYIILGLPFDSSQEDIKAAYRRLAKEYLQTISEKILLHFQVFRKPILF